MVKPLRIRTRIYESGFGCPPEVMRLLRSLDRGSGGSVGDVGDVGELGDVRLFPFRDTESLPSFANKGLQMLIVGYCVL